MNNSTIYEFPLNERIRTLLRLEFLFKQARYSLRGYSLWDSRNTVECILDILDIMSRIDLRMELVKELDRQSAALVSISSRPGVDPSILDETLNQLSQYLKSLKSNSLNSCEALRNNELLNVIRKRDSIPGGNCDFDIPSYHFWLQQSAESRTETLESWLSDLDDYRLAINVILNLLRESAVNSPVTADKGFYQQALDTSMSFQLIRAFLPVDAPYFAEFSGGKHRFSVRFMIPNNCDRPSPYSDEINFQLACCAL